MCRRLNILFSYFDFLWLQYCAGLQLNFKLQTKKTFVPKSHLLFYIYTYIHTYIYSNTHAYIHTYIHTYTHIYVCI